MLIGFVFSIFLNKMNSKLTLHGRKQFSYDVVLRNKESSCLTPVTIYIFCSKTAFQINQGIIFVTKKVKPHFGKILVRKACVCYFYQIFIFFIIF